MQPENDQNPTEKTDIIVSDADTQQSDTSEDSRPDPTKWTLSINEDPQSVFQLVRKAEKGNLVLDPDFQRNQVWKSDQKSRFVESILMGFPIPPFYVNEQTDGKWIIIDGLQRISTLIGFMSNEFALTGLKALTNLNGKTFSESSDCLDSALQTRIEDKKLNIYILKSSTPLPVIYELFDRINTGGTPLNRQEVRHCIFKGKSTALLKELAEQAYFKTAIDNGVSPMRMKDREIILRYLAFRILGVSAYDGDLSGFVERAMEHINKMSDAEVEALKVDFKRVMEWSHKLFATANFRYPVRNAQGEVTGRGFINTSIFESICLFLSNRTDVYLQQHQAQITQNFQTLLQDPTYTDAVRFSTGSKFRVVNRFGLAEEILAKQ